MNTLRKSIIAGVAATLAVAAVANAAPPAKPQTRDIAMVVNVSKAGKVTEIQPADNMPPWEHALVMQKFNQWITQPTTDKHGNPTSSRFIMQLAMTTTQRADGNYAATFKLLKTLPIGFAGPVHWNRVQDSGELYLVSDLNNAPQAVPMSQPLNVPPASAAPPPPPPPPPHTSSSKGH